MICPSGLWWLLACLMALPVSGLRLKPFEHCTCVAARISGVFPCSTVPLQHSVLLRRFFPDALQLDKVESISSDMCREWATRAAGCSLVIVGAGPPCQGVSTLNAHRLGAINDPRGSLHSLVHPIMDMVRQHFTWCPVHFLEESVLNMDLHDRRVYTDAAKVLPNRICASGVSPCRLCISWRNPFSTWIFMTDVFTLTLPRCCPTGSVLQGSLLAAASGFTGLIGHLRLMSLALFTRLLIPAMRVMPKSISTLENVLWESSSRAGASILPLPYYPLSRLLSRVPLPGQTLQGSPSVPKKCDHVGRLIASGFRLTTNTKMNICFGMRVWLPGLLMCLNGSGASDFRVTILSTVNCFPKNEIKSSPLKHEDTRLTLFGNAWSIPVIGWLLLQLLRPLGLCVTQNLDELLNLLFRDSPILSDSLLYWRSFTAPGKVCDPDLEQTLTRKLLTLLSTRGEDILIHVSGTSRGHQKFRNTVPFSLWHWRTICGWSWARQAEHINRLELRAVYATLMWRVVRKGGVRLKFVHLTDSMVSLHVVNRGRSSSHKTVVAVSCFFPHPCRRSPSFHLLGVHPSEPS